jgi:hypothetical protein
MQRRNSRYVGGSVTVVETRNNSITYKSNGTNFPIYSRVAGTMSGQKWCNSCTTVLSCSDTTACHFCNGNLIFYRQHLLEECKRLDLGLAYLIKEPTNSFNPKAIAVFVKYPRGERMQIGYVPDNPKSEKEFNSETIYELLDKGTKLWTLVTIVGGEALEDGTIKAYGARLTVSDKPL